MTTSSSLSLESNEVHVTAPSCQESMSPLSNHGVVIPAAESLRNQLAFSSQCLKILHLVVDTAVSLRSWRWKKKHSYEPMSSHIRQLARNLQKDILPLKKSNTNQESVQKVHQCSPEYPSCQKS